MSLIFSSIFLFNYSYFKGNDGLFLLDALDASVEKNTRTRLSFSVDSLTWILFRAHLKRYDHLGIMIAEYKYRIPDVEQKPDKKGGFLFFSFFKVEDCLMTLEKNTYSGGNIIAEAKLHYIEPYPRSNSAIVFFKSIGESLTEDDYKIIDIFQNTKRIPYLKSIALQIKTMPFFLESELNYIKTDQNILLEIPVLLLVVLFSIPYLFIQVIVPPSLSIPFFWLWVVFSVFYIVTPYSALKNIGERIKEVSKKKKDKN